jgi:hypothetical protein
MRIAHFVILCGLSAAACVAQPTPAPAPPVTPIKDQSEAQSGEPQPRGQPGIPVQATDERN